MRLCWPVSVEHSRPAWQSPNSAKLPGPPRRAGAVSPVEAISPIDPGALLYNIKRVGGLARIAPRGIFREISIFDACTPLIKGGHSALLRHLNDPTTLVIGQLFVQSWGQKPG
jgi:hypothetical protein